MGVVCLGLLVTPDLSHSPCKPCMSESETWSKKSFVGKLYGMSEVVVEEVPCPEPPELEDQARGGGGKVWGRSPRGR